MGVSPDLTVKQARSDLIYPAVVPASNAGIVLGGSLLLGGFFKNRIALGIGLYQPVARPSRLEAPVSS